jgi:hypothetical protein
VPVESEPHFDSGQRSSTPQALPIEFFAVPQGAPGSDPAGDSHPNTCAESSAYDAAPNPGAMATLSPAANENSAAPPCEKPTLVVAEVEVKVQEKPAPADKVVAPAASTDVPAPVEIQLSPSSSIWLPEDKRSCRLLAGDGLIL